MFKIRRILAIFLCLTVVVELNLTALGVQNDESINDFVTTTEPDNNQYNITSPVKSSVTSAEAKNAATSGTCGENVTWNYNTSTDTLTISGTGAMSSYSESLYCGTLVTTAPWREYYNKMKTLVINSGVTSIGYCAFYSCIGLTSITIGNSVTSIGEDAFYNCTGLTKVNYKGTIVNWCKISFGSNPLSYARNLYINNKLVTDLVIPDTVKDIKNYAFYNCTSLTSITIPDSVTSIGSSAFYGCTGLTRITIGNSVTSIGDYAFKDCTGLTSITIPNSVTSIADDAFCWCTGLKSITIPRSVTSIGGFAFYGCSSLTSITIPGSVTSIGGGAFYYCTGLKTAGPIGSGYNIEFGWTKSIPENAFSYCTSLTSITIPDSVTSIGSYAFNGCTGLTSITIPESVTSIGGSAFNGCTGLKTVYFLGFEEDWEKISIGNYNAPFTNATKVFPEECGANSGWMIIKSTLHIIGSGATDNYKMQSSVPWYEYRDEITEIRIESGVTKVGTYAFYCLDNLKTVKSENKDLQLSKYSLNADNKNITAYSTGGGVLQEYCDQNGINFVKPTPDTPSAPVLSAVNGTSITVKEEPGTEYSLDKTNWQDSGVFTGLSPVTEYFVYARIKETEEHYASGISAALTVKTTKLNNDEIPPAPTLKSVASSSISVNTETGIEYSINGTSWNTAGTFSELKSGTEYSVFARYIETATHFASMASEPLIVKTDKATVSAPAAPDYEAHTENSITLKSNSKYEFSMDGENWQKSNIFTNLSKNTIYRFYQRVAETDTEYVSTSSPALITAIPDKPKVINTSIESITVRQIEGFEYCLDDMVWQKSNVFDMLIEGMEYYVYQRIAAIPGEKVYQITSEYTLAFAIEPCVTHTYNGWENNKKGHWQKCARCGEMTTANSHTFGKWTVTTPATCTNVGKEKQVCTICGYEETRDIEALGHDYKAVITEPTCTEQGYTTHICSRCNDSYKDSYTDALGHTPGETIIENSVAATCETAGSYDEVVYCTVCHAELSRDTKTVLALGHKWDNGTVTKDPTCTEKGIKAFTCQTDASHTYIEYIDALGHKPGETTIENSVAATCETAGSYDEVVYCTVCKAELSRDTKTVLALGHDWSEEWTNDGTNHWHKCKRCEEISDNAEHTYGEWIEIKPAKVDENGERKHVCEICGYEEHEEFELGYIPGDMNGDEGVTDQDAVYLLFYTFFPEDYPINQSCDFNGDGKTDDQDAVYLLFYTFFPEDYPLN